MRVLKQVHNFAQQRFNEPPVLLKQIVIQTTKKPDKIRAIRGFVVYLWALVVTGLLATETKITQLEIKLDRTDDTESLVE